MNLQIEKNLEDISNLFEDSHRGETCFILGNGPSLTSDLIEKIAQKTMFTFTVNRFALVLDSVQIDIHAVCMSNQEAIDKYMICILKIH